LIIVFVAMAYFVTLRVGVGAVIVTLLSVVLPAIRVIGDGVIVVVVITVVMIVAVVGAKVEVLVTLWMMLVSKITYWTLSKRT
jgi:hypothetical protein